MMSFFALIDRLNAASPADRPGIENLIWESFLREKAVLTLDMSGFSLRVRREGILAHLCQMRRMHFIAVPMLRDHKGELVKREADNLLAVFDDPGDAVHAAVAINRAITAPAEPPRSDPPLAVSIGIDYGKLLLIRDSDCFGDPVNVAFKLGEDVARAGEILITEGVKERLGEPTPYPLQKLALSLSGLEIRAYKVLYGSA